MGRLEALLAELLLLLGPLAARNAASGLAAIDAMIAEQHKASVQRQYDVVIRAAQEKIRADMAGLAAVRRLGDRKDGAGPSRAP